MLLQSSTRLFPVFLASVLLSGCVAPQQGGQQQGQGVSKTVKYGAVGAVGGAVVGAATSSRKDRGKGALIGAAVGGAAGAGYGYYVDRQEAALRAQMQGSGVGVNRQGDVLQLVMPDVTFATNSSTITNDFYAPLNRLAANLSEFDQNSIEIVGHTDSTGSRATNMRLSEQRAQSVANYLRSQGVPAQRISSYGVGPDRPVASNADAGGRSQNRRVEITLHPLPGN